MKEEVAVATEEVAAAMEEVVIATAEVVIATAEVEEEVTEVEEDLEVVEEVVEEVMVEVHQPETSQRFVTNSTMMIKLQLKSRDFHTKSDSKKSVTFSTEWATSTGVLFSV